MGNLPLLASCVAAINPTVAAGNTTNASAAPIKGICDTNEINAMNMKNKPPIASGCLKNVLIPDFTQAVPVRAGTTFKEIIVLALVVDGSDMFVYSVKNRIFGSRQLVRMRHPLLQHPLEMFWVMRFEHAGFARQMKVPQPRNPKSQRCGALHGGQ